MLNIFSYKDNQFVVEDINILHIKSINALWQLDKTVEKEYGYKLLKFLYLYGSFKSPFYHYIEEDKRKTCLEECDLIEKDIPKVMEDAVKTYQEIENSKPLIKMLKSMYLSIDKLLDYPEQVDFKEKIEHGASKGRLLYEPKDLISIVKEADKLTSQIKKLEDTYRKELSDEARVKGQIKIGRFQ